LPFHRKHSFARRQEHPGSGLQARIHIQRHIRSRRLFLILQLFQLRFIPCGGRRFHLLRRCPINHRRWNLFPSPALQAEVPDPFSIPRVLSHQLKIPVLQNQLLPVRRPTRQTRFALLLPRTLFHRLTRIRPRRRLFTLSDERREGRSQQAAHPRKHHRQNCSNRPPHVPRPIPLMLTLAKSFSHPQTTLPAIPPSFPCLPSLFYASKSVGAHATWLCPSWDAPFAFCEGRSRGACAQKSLS